MTPLTWNDRSVFITKDGQCTSFVLISSFILIYQEGVVQRNTLVVHLIHSLDCMSMIELDWANYIEEVEQTADKWQGWRNEDWQMKYLDKTMH